MIALVTVTYNSECVLPDFLDSVDAQDCSLRLYAVDNDSKDDSVRSLTTAHDRRFELEVLPQPRNAGIACGNNVGIRKALADGAEWIVLINNDTEFDGSLVSRLRSTADQTGARIVVPSIRFHDRPTAVWFESARFARWRGSVPVSRPPQPVGSVTEISCACTCCALVHRSVFDDVGLMDENYFVYWDDTDFFLRCHRAGVQMVLDAGAVVLHKVSSLTGGGESDFSASERIKNRVYFIRKHNGPLVRAAGLTVTMINVLQLWARDGFRRARLRLLLASFVKGARQPVAR